MLYCLYKWLNTCRQRLMWTGAIRYFHWKVWYYLIEMFACDQKMKQYREKFRATIYYDIRCGLSWQIDQLTLTFGDEASHIGTAKRQCNELNLGSLAFLEGRLKRLQCENQSMMCMNWYCKIYISRDWDILGHWWDQHIHNITWNFVRHEDLFTLDTL